MLEFGTVEPWVRVAVFGGVFAGAALIAWWSLTSPAVGAWRQLVVAAGALATIPAVILAGFEGGTPVAALGTAGIAGFLFAAAAGLGPALAARQRASDRIEPPAEAIPTTPQARVASYAGLTEALAGEPAEHTVVLKSASDVKEVAFVVDYAGDGHPFRLRADNRIGRDGSAEIPIEDTGASRDHARIKLVEGRFVLYDLGSTNGTRLVRNGRRRKLGAPAPLQDLDMVEIGSSRLVFLELGGAP